jgi:hypothetical protein
MKRGESRFFLNWQLSKNDAAALHQARTDKERTTLLEKWISSNSGLVSVADVDDEEHWAVLINFFEGHFDVAKAAKFDQLKMSCFLEIMLYIIKDMLANRPSEEKSFALFKELLLRHSVQRPPHSLAIFNLEDLNVINEHVNDTFFRFYKMYLYSLTKDQLITLKTVKQTNLEEPHLPKLSEGKIIPPREVDISLQMFLSEAEKEQIEKENEYMTNGPGRIERIMREEMDKLATVMEEKIRLQDEDFLNRLAKK